MKTFDWEKFKLGGIAVHCKTEQECENFLKMYKVVPQNRKNYFSQLGGDICYSMDFDKHLRYYTVSYCDDRGDTILEWDDYMEFTNDELSVGMLVETSFGKGIVMPSHSESVAVGSGGDWCSLDFEDVEKVWDYPDDPHFALDCTGRYRKLLYERPTTKEMTLEEVSKALGYNIKIVKGQ